MHPLATSLSRRLRSVAFIHQTMLVDDLTNQGIKRFLAMTPLVTPSRA